MRRFHECDLPDYCVERLGTPAASLYRFQRREAVRPDFEASEEGGPSQPEPERNQDCESFPNCNEAGVVQLGAEPAAVCFCDGLCEILDDCSIYHQYASEAPGGGVCANSRPGATRGRVPTMEARDSAHFATEEGVYPARSDVERLCGNGSRSAVRR